MSATATGAGGAPVHSPLTPITAVTSDDPYPYYRTLVDDRPFYFDDGLGMWVAGSAEAVSAVLRCPALGVRPPAEPVPAGLLGTAAGEVFGRLVRMTDGAAQHTLKPLVSAAAATADPARATALARRRSAEVLAADRTATGRATALPRLLFEVPVGVVGELCGLPPTVDVAEATRRFVGCIPASATPADYAAAAEAVVSLSALLAALLSADNPAVLGALSRAAHRAGVADPQALLANAIGLLSQTYDATAGLIGNTLLAWRRDRAAAAPETEVTTAYVLEVARHDAPIQNTRRFAHHDVELLGRTVRQGQPILVVLAAANRDPAANADPDVFDPARDAPSLFTFGLGAHECPGRQLAVVIAAAVVRTALEHGIDDKDLPETVRYRALPNARIPELCA